MSRSVPEAAKVPEAVVLAVVEGAQAAAPVVVAPEAEREVVRAGEQVEEPAAEAEAAPVEPEARAAAVERVARAAAELAERGEATTIILTQTH